MTILDDMRDQAQQIHISLIDELRQINDLNDDMMSEKGIAQVKAERSADARQRANAALTNLRTQAVGMSKRAEDSIAPYLRPGRSTRDDWHRVEMLLDSGRGLGDVIAQASAEELQAIVEWAPTWVKARTKPGVDSKIAPSAYAEAIRNDVLGRWAQISDSDVFTNALATFDAVSAVDRVGSATDVIIAGRTPSAHDVLAAGFAQPTRITLADITTTAVNVTA